MTSSYSSSRSPIIGKNIAFRICSCRLLGPGVSWSLFGTTSGLWSLSGGKILSFITSINWWKPHGIELTSRMSWSRTSTNPGEWPSLGILFWIFEQLFELDFSVASLGFELEEFFWQFLFPPSQLRLKVSGEKFRRLVWKGIFGIRDFTKKCCEIRDLTAPGKRDSPKFGHGMRDIDIKRK